MVISSLLLIVGLACVFFELLMPGFGILGIIGSVLVFSSWGITIFTSTFGIIIVLLEIAIISLVFFLVIKKLKRMQIYSKFILSDVLAKDKKQVGNMEDFIGREGICKTDLRPFGSAEFNGIVLDVISDDGYIKRNSLIRVMKFDENKLYVKLVNSN